MQARQQNEQKYAIYQRRIQGNIKIEAATTGAYSEREHMKQSYLALLHVRQPYQVIAS